MPLGRRSALLVALALVLGLTLGSVGAATAGGLSTRAVKKIAAKVLKKKSKTLSVQHATTATTATNATELGGQAPSAYQNQAFTVTLSVSNSVPSFAKALPAGIPNGTYLISVYVNALESASSPLYCQLYGANGADRLVDGYAQLFSNSAIVSATRVGTVDGPMVLYCKISSGNFTTPIPSQFNYSAPQISFVRMDSTTALGDAPAAR